mgnify:FL=1
MEKAETAERKSMGEVYGTDPYHDMARKDVADTLTTYSSSPSAKGGCVVVQWMGKPKDPAKSP